MKSVSVARSNDELLQLVSEIEGKAKPELEKLLAEADVSGKLMRNHYRYEVFVFFSLFSCVGKGNVLRNKWRQDVTERMEEVT